MTANHGGDPWSMLVIWGIGLLVAGALVLLDWRDARRRRRALAADTFNVDHIDTHGMRVGDELCVSSIGELPCGLKNGDRVRIVAIESSTIRLAPRRRRLIDWLFNRNKRSP